MEPKTIGAGFVHKCSDIILPYTYLHDIFV